jgi:hypothetical protein
MLLAPAQATALEPTAMVEEAPQSSTVTGSGRPEAPVRFAGTRRAKTPPRAHRAPRSRTRAGVFGWVKRPARFGVAI